MSARLICLLLSAGLCCGAYANDVYKWKDDKGVVHYGDPPVGQWKDKATKVERKTSEPTALQREEAQARAVRGKEALAPRGHYDQQAPVSASATGPADQPAMPDQPVDPDAECARQTVEWKENVACFNRHRLANGGVRGEAFQQCQDIKRPACYQPEMRGGLNPERKSPGDYK